MIRITFILLATWMFVNATADAETVFITGSNRGIGLEFARQYAEKNWNVIATCRRPEEAKDLRALADLHPNISIDKLDVNDHAAIDALAKKYKSTSIDVLLNNAGILGDRESQNKFGELSYENMERVYRTNTLGPLKVSEAFIDHVAASDQKKIAVIASGTASLTNVRYREGMGRYYSSLYAYRMSKVAVNMAMRVLAVDMREKGITVGIMAPGIVETRLLQQAGFGGRGIDPVVSVTGVIKNIENMSLETSGQYIIYTGDTVPW